MCTLCIALIGDHWTEQRGGRRGRILRVGVVNRVLAHFGLHLHDWAGRVYVLQDGKGGTAVIGDLGSLWREAERLARRPLDPLDPALLDSITG
jgi:hypothetical protein